MNQNTDNRSFTGDALAAILGELAKVNIIASGLKYDLEPLAPEDVEAGAEPLTPEQISDDLDLICTIVTKIVLEHLNATTDEWLIANDAIE